MRMTVSAMSSSPQAGDWLSSGRDRARAAAAGHPLWRLPNCIVTPHTAGTWEMVMPRLAARIAANVAHFAAGQPLDGLIDADAGYLPAGR